MSSWTKREIVHTAYEEIGLANYVYDLAPEQLQGAVNRLDTMMAQFNMRGIRLSYPLFSNPRSIKLDDETELPDYAVEAIILQLALRIAPSVGKEVSLETRANAKSSLNNLYATVAFPNERVGNVDGVPAGAGYKRTRKTLNPAPQRIDAGNDSPLDFY